MTYGLHGNGVTVLTVLRQSSILVTSKEDQLIVIELAISLFIWKVIRWRELYSVLVQREHVFTIILVLEK